MVKPTVTLRVARPTDNLAQISEMYQAGLGFVVLGEFSDHDGFDGVILGHPQQPYHLEFTHHHGTKVGKAPTPDNLLVFYLPDAQEWQTACDAMGQAGFEQVASYNPYWDKQGKSFADLDGYRVVLQNRSWSA
ncbi:MAG: hypothetical protein DHS20C20_16500 [Ardenticatenaceae bacterium]|nr:MAG: hypothetical protein DHS20C20_16500 [Ardenticatenaceae bacterium]